jgi:hypothetical protein
MAFAYGVADDRSSALAELAALRRMSSDGAVLPFNLALVKLGLGEPERSTAWSKPTLRTRS